MNPAWALPPCPLCGSRYPRRSCRGCDDGGAMADEDERRGDDDRKMSEEMGESEHSGTIPLDNDPPDGE